MHKRKDNPDCITWNRWDI